MAHAGHRAELVLVVGVTVATNTSLQLLGGRYRLRRQIGAGGMAGVHLAHDERLGRDVAVKLTRPDADVDGRGPRRIEQEARRVARLNHPNVVQVHDVGTADDLAYIVMELVHGRGLDEVIRDDGPLPEREAVRITVEVCRGLAAAHEAGIVHHDIKPGNVLVADDGRVRIADFGIARAHDGHTMTEERPFGSAPYVAPEQVNGGRADHRSDLYSLGVVLYEMLTGRPPFVGDTMAATVLERLHRDPDPPSRSVHVSPALEQVVMTTLAREPGDRFPDAVSLEAALRAAARLTSGAPHPEPTAPLPAAPLPQRRLARGGSVLITALAALAAVGWTLSSILGASPIAVGVSVPDVSDMTIAVAARVLASHDLRVGSITRERDARATAGTVVAQDPPPGTEIDPGGAVDLVVAAPTTAATPIAEPQPNPEPSDSSAPADTSPTGDVTDTSPAGDVATVPPPPSEKPSKGGSQRTDPPGHGGVPPGQGSEPPGKPER